MDIPTQAQIRPEDIVLAVMGPNGSGKSHFIDVLTRQPGQQISQATHTDGVQVTLIQDYYGGYNLALVDLPGFDDVNRNDLEILYVTSEWLRRTYQNKIRLTGILYMHRITDSRMGVTSLKSLRFLGEICGDAAMTQVTLVTTMWDRLQGTEVGESREGELRKYFWKTMLDKGSQMGRFSNTNESGKAIVDGVILRTSKREALLLQQELVDLGKRPGETGAGQVLYLSLQQLLDEQRATMEKLAAHMEGQNNPHLLEGLRKEHKRIEQDMQKALDDVRRLKAPLSRRIATLLFAKKGKPVSITSLPSLEPILTEGYIEGDGKHASAFKSYRVIYIRLV
ncbi:hypothetical protein P691DRAFT_423575 [Macrolepiota fuliginosa MF-IS2]|uniref:G domain-containing protein n=1 Tax=Macrolepiota fuliginosa MF-IS2 TaxID=1400762 RepID=A0A9P5XGC7_9AGAR|nr:hypothetical protein P691DRAFT_423575 [Macrolepiota fuliginosa MF-IS2]